MSDYKSFREYGETLDNGVVDIEEALKEKGIDIDHDLKVEEIPEKIREIKSIKANMIGGYYFSSLILSIAKNGVNQIDFGTFDIPEDKTLIDVSIEQDGSILLWESGYTVFKISSQGKIKPDTCCGMFANLGVQSLSFGDNFDTSDVTNMAYMFYNCRIPYYPIKNLNTSKVTNMRGMFSGCSSIYSISTDTPNFDTSNVTDMSYMFSGCSNLSSLTINNLDTNKVTDMSGMFNGCSRLSSIEFGENFNTSNVTNMNYMFYNCSNLSSIPINRLDTRKVTDMQYMFYSCTRLMSIELGKDFDTSNVLNMQYMFYNCSNLSSIPIDDFNTINVLNMRYMFYGCSGLSSIEFKDNFNTSSLCDMNFMFSYCTNLQSIKFGDNFDTSNVTSMIDTFSYCNNLQSIKFGDNFDTSNVTSMREMFYNCKSLNVLDLSCFNTDKVSDMVNMFYNCNSLKTLNLNNFSVQAITYSGNLSYLFYNCSQLETIIAKNWIDENSTISSAYRVFYNCSSLPNYSSSNVSGEYCKPIEEGGYFTEPKGKEDVFLDVEKLHDELEMFAMRVDECNFIEGIPSNLKIQPGLCNDISENQDGTIIYELLDPTYDKVNIYYKENCTLKVRNANDMFTGSIFGQITELDIRMLDVSECEDFDLMFCSLSFLENIYCNDDWTEINPKVLEADNMFPLNVNYTKGYSGSMAKPKDLGGYFTRK